MATRKEWRDEGNKWLDRVQMSRGYDINFTFEKETDLSEEDKALGFAAACTSDPEYKRHTIWVLEDWLKKANKKDLTEYSCHEVIHCLLSPVKSLANSIIEELPKNKQSIYKRWLTAESEKLTTHLANIMVNEAKTWRDN